MCVTQIWICGAQIYVHEQKTEKNCQGKQVSKIIQTWLAANKPKEDQ